MGRFIPLEEFLDDWAGQDAQRQPVAQVVRSMARAGCQVADLIARGPLAGALGAVLGDNTQGDAQKELDVRANDLIVEALRTAPVATIASEELEEPLANKAGAPICVAIDPLDGSSNIDTNVSIGTIFSVLPTNGEVSGRNGPPFLQPGNTQLAAGYIIYGPQTTLVLTVGEGTQFFTLDRSADIFRLTCRNALIPAQTREFAINASNYRHWDDRIRTYVDDCLSGEVGLREMNFNMRWVASLVAECHRILSRGGIFLYPGDARKGYQAGRLRLIYEANPIAWLVEQAGGAATTGETRILDIEPTAIHQRTPLIFGSRDEAERLVRHLAGPHSIGERSPLFAHRGLFRTP